MTDYQTNKLYEKIKQHDKSQIVLVRDGICMTMSDDGLEGGKVSDSCILLLKYLSSNVGFVTPQVHFSAPDIFSLGVTHHMCRFRVYLNDMRF